MVAEQLARAVREQVGLGRLLPLGGPGDAVWLAETAAAGVLRAAADGVPGVRLGRLRIGLAGPDPDAGGADPEDGPEGDGGPEGGPGRGAALRPPSALPPGPLRVEAEFAAAADAPLPDQADALRAVLAAAAEDRLGFAPAGIDLLVSGLLDDEPAPDGPDGPDTRDTPDARDTADETAEADATDGRPVGAPGSHRGTAAEVADAVLAVPGVARLAAVVGGSARAVRLAEDGAQIQLATSGTARPVLEVARAARRAAAGAAGTDRVAVLVTAVD